jgi:hypothetical protein
MELKKIHWQTLSRNVVSSTPRLSRYQTHNVSGDRHSPRKSPTCHKSQIYHINIYYYKFVLRKWISRSNIALKKQEIWNANRSPFRAKHINNRMFIEDFYRWRQYNHDKLLYLWFVNFHWTLHLR